MTEQFILKEDSEGELYTVINPVYQKELNKKRKLYFFQKAGIPPYYNDINWDDYVGELSKISKIKVMDYAKNITDKKYLYKHLYLHGGNSCQKTALGINVLKEAFDKGLSINFILAGTLIKKLMKVQGFSYHQNIEDYLNEIYKSDVVMIDDSFDSKKSLMWKDLESRKIIISAWDEFLRPLLASKTKVIFSSNLNTKEISNDFGKDLAILIERNCFAYHFIDNVQNIRQQDFEGVI